MKHVPSQQDFWELAPAAEKIFSYVRGNPEFGHIKLEFEYGLIDEPSSRAIVKFACVSCRHCDHAVVWVTAATQMDGSWLVSHSIAWGE